MCPCVCIVFCFCECMCQGDFIVIVCVTCVCFGHQILKKQRDKGKNRLQRSTEPRNQTEMPTSSPFPISQASHDLKWTIMAIISMLFLPSRAYSLLILPFSVFPLRTFTANTSPPLSKLYSSPPLIRQVGTC